MHACHDGDANSVCSVSCVTTVLVWEPDSGSLGGRRLWRTAELLARGN